jgi:hypothetical protein
MSVQGLAAKMVLDPEAAAVGAISRTMLRIALRRMAATRSLSPAF